MFLIRVVSSNVVLTFLIVLSFPVYLFLICDVFVLLFSLVLIFLIGVVFSSLYYSELSCISFILFLNCAVHPNFFRPGPTDLQLVFRQYCYTNWRQNNIGFISLFLSSTVNVLLPMEKIYNTNILIHHIFGLHKYINSKEVN